MDKIKNALSVASEYISSKPKGQRVLLQSTVEKYLDDALALWKKPAQFNAVPSSEHNILVTQFNSLLALANSLEAQLAYYRKQDYDTSEQRLKALEEALESERAMNAKLTSELQLTEDCIMKSYRVVKIPAFGTSVDFLYCAERYCKNASEWIRIHNRLRYNREEAIQDIEDYKLRWQEQEVVYEE